MHIKTLKIMNSVLCVCVPKHGDIKNARFLLTPSLGACTGTHASTHAHAHTHTHTHTHTPHTHNNNNNNTHNTHTHTHSWFVVFSHVPHFLHTHTVWHVFFSISPCCRIPLCAVKKWTHGQGKPWIKSVRQVFSQVHTRRTPSPRPPMTKQRDVCKTFNLV